MNIIFSELFLNCFMFGFNCVFHSFTACTKALSGSTYLHSFEVTKTL